MSRRWEIAAVVVLLILAAWVRGRVADGWVYAGSDSYGYIKLADELRVHHRYALGPNEPLHFARVPGYPIFLALTKGGAPAGMNGGPGWDMIKRGQRWFDFFIALPLLFLLARRLGGPKAGLIALGIAAVFPFTVIFTAVALTESISTTLTVAAIAPLILGARRPRTWFAVAGAMVGLATLVRPDGILLASAFVPAILLLRPNARRWRERAIVGALSLAGFLVAYGGWPVRNLADFGRPIWLGQHTNRFARPLDHYQGYWSWMRTWCGGWECQTAPATCFFNPPCVPSVAEYPAAAVDGGDLPTVEKLFAERARDGLSPAVSVGFQKLADARRARHPLQVLVKLPLERAWHMWVARRDEVLPPNWRPWRQVTNRIAPHFRTLSFALLLALLLSGALLLLRRDTRGAALVLLVPIVTRSLVLPFELYSMPRYAVEVMPLAFVLIAVALALARRDGAGHGEVIKSGG
jgi:4-amino-4-deoxy-L-arabinose transferase-like glycosyltransferase